MRSCWRLKISAHEAEKLSLESICRFVASSEELQFEGENRQQVYGWVERVLVQQSYGQQGKAPRGLLRRYMEKMTGLSRAQVKRLIARYTTSGRVAATVYRRRCFPKSYTRADIELLAAVDEAHETLSGPATRRILEREHQLYVKPEYASTASRSTRGWRPSPSLIPTTCASIRAIASGSCTYLETPHGGLHWRAAQAATAEPTRLFTRGYGASGRSARRRRQGRLSHQRRR